MIVSKHLFLIILFLAGCVGTIEDSQLKKTKTVANKLSSLPFSGLSNVKPISHDKVEVYFYPANGKPEDLTYEIYVNGSETPIFITGTSMTPNPAGQLMYTVTGLRVNTTYTFAVSVRNNESKRKSDEGDIMSATTFQNITADFAGIGSVRSPAGTAGQNSVVVEWVGAVTTGTPFNPKTADPVGYEIVYISEAGGAANLNNPSHPDRKVNVSPNPIANPPMLSSERSRTITPLDPGTKYYFQVRAIHKGYVLYGGLGGDPNYKREENHKYLAITTLMDTGMFTFDINSVKAIAPDGELAKTNLDITWKPATGDFYNYRIYYKEMGKEKVMGDPVEDASTVIPSAEPDYFSDAGGQIDRLNGVPAFTSVSADASYYRLPNLPPYRYFQLKVVACGDEICDAANRQVSDPMTFTQTFPKIAPFDGISQIDHPRSESTTNRIHAVFNPPVVASGFLDDLVLYCYSSPTDTSPKPLIYAPSQVGAGFGVVGSGLGGTFIEITDGDYSRFPNSGAVIIGNRADPNLEIFEYTSKATVPSRLISTTDTLNFNHVQDEPVYYTVKSADNCNGVYRNTPSPSSQLDYEEFDEIDIDGITPSVGKTYCFSLVPKIDGDNTHYYQGTGTGDGSNENFKDIEDISNAVVKCIAPEIKTPTLAQFPGKSPSCSVPGRTIDVSWEKPTGGMYNAFQVFWKRNTGTPFQFTQAKQVIPPWPAATSGQEYWSEDGEDGVGLDTDATSYNIDPTDFAKPPLIPGQRYYTGVLAYLQDETANPLNCPVGQYNGTVGCRYYSETNLNTNDCLIDLPTATFVEWTEVFAIGPKVNGLIPPDPVTGKRTMILETLDDSTVPVEVVLEGSGAGAGINIDESTSGFYLMRGSTGAAGEFNGAYGVMDGDSDNPKYQYSNTGIVRIAWKDMKLFSGPDLFMKNMIASYESPSTPQDADFPFPYPTEKKNRVFGYKVYRSDNNKVTWTELTHKDFSGQTTANSGLVRSSSRKTHVRNNAADDTDEIITFTDYSVNYVDNNGEVERGRIYWYKVVPVFNSTPLAMSSSTNIIKVTLPPPNMALVHRMMANRTICRELGSAIDKTPGKHYSCPYNGVGASGLSNPWPICLGGVCLPGEPGPVYDLGGDLLVDRFELGCNWTRGDPRETAVAQSDYNTDFWDSPNDLMLARFQGKTQTYMGGPEELSFKGCAGPDWTGNEPMQGHAGSGSSNTDESYGRVHQGDCFGSYYVNMASGQCTDYLKTQVLRYAWPGAVPFMDNDVDDNCQATSPIFDFGTYYGAAPNTPNYWGDDWNDPAGGVSNDGYPFQNHLVQSEPAAVFYIRPRTGSYDQQQFPSSAGGGQYITPPGGNNTVAGQCFINLPFVNQNHDNPARVGQGDWTARWFGINKLFRNNLNVPGMGTMTIYDKTVDEMLAMSGFYSPGTQPNVWPATKRFNKAATPLGKIISSNNAKLPPLGNLAQIDVYNLCQLYTVEIGTYDGAAGSGSGIFFQIDAPAGKRIMTKKEFNVVAAWPDINSEASSGSGILGINTYDETMVTAVEEGTAYDHVRNKLNNGALQQGDLSGCNTKNRFANGQAVGWDTQLNPLFPNVSSETDPYLWGGSSPNDVSGTNQNSSRCISKFGVQDLVGNMMEVVAEQVFCDFTGEVMYLGPNGSSAGQSGSIQMQVSGLGSGPGLISGGPLPANPPETYEGGNRGLSWYNDWRPYRVSGATPLGAWVKSLENTGKCSTAQIGGDREDKAVSPPLSYRSDTSMNSIFDPTTFSGYNDLVIEWHGDDDGTGTGTGWGAHRTFAQELVLDSRGGDGYFLDWGQTNYAPPIAYKEVMNLKGVAGTDHLAMFFNPATGFPGACMEGPNVPPAPCADSPDNKDWTTATMRAKHSANGIFAGAAPTDFPTNNGDFHNDGLRDLNFSNWYVSPNQTETSFRYIDRVIPGNAFPEDDQWEMLWATGVIGDNVTTSWAWWTISRSDPVYFNVGGDATTTDAGRYYAYMRGDSPANQEDNYTRGGRCVIKINTAD